MIIISDYSDKGEDKAMNVRTVILKTIAGIYNWIQAAEILGYTPRHMSRIKKRYEEYGRGGLFDLKDKNRSKAHKNGSIRKDSNALQR